MHGQLIRRSLGTLVAVALLAGCSPTESTNQESHDTPPGAEEAYAPEIDPANFVSGIDNPFFPMTPGNTWFYEGETEDGLEHIEVVVLDETREVMGVESVVVHDTVTIDGEMVEDTFDWYAQDKDGNVWYMGEDVKNYKNGEFTDSHGAWEAGVDGALPGIVMWADPQPGEPYRQELYAGEAEDMAKVVRLDGEAKVPFGVYTDLLVTEDWTPLEPGFAERKYYAKGIGVVLEEIVEGGEGRMELVGMMTK